MNGRLEVFRSVEWQCWCVRMVDNPEMFDLFGTDILPLPFTLEATLEQVLEGVRARNPMAEVVARS